MRLNLLWPFFQQIDYLWGMTPAPGLLDAVADDTNPEKGDMNDSVERGGDPPSSPPNTSASMISFDPALRLDKSKLHGKRRKRRKIRKKVSTLFPRLALLYYSLFVVPSQP